MIYDGIWDGLQKALDKRNRNSRIKKLKNSKQGGTVDIVGMKKEVARLTKENEKLKSKFNVLHENEELEKQIRLLESDIRTIGNFSNITFEIHLMNEYTSSRYGYLGQERGELINKSFILSEEVQNSFKNHLLSLLDEKILENKNKIKYNKEQLTKNNYDK